MENTAIVTSDTARLMRNALKSPEDLSKNRNCDRIKYHSVLHRRTVVNVCILFHIVVTLVSEIENSMSIVY
jgi:hypothetical protein